MMFPILGGALVRKRGAVTFVCLIQAILVSVSGVLGGHGIFSLLTYLAPGVVVDFLWFLLKSDGDSLISCFLGGMAANLSGTVIVNLIFFNMPWAPLLMIGALALFSGGLGGIAAWNVGKHIRRLKALP
jgi:hypothetical protein